MKAITFALNQDLLTQTLDLEREYPGLAPRGSPRGGPQLPVSSSCTKHNLPTKEIWCFVQITAAHILHILFGLFFPFSLPSSHRNQSWGTTFEVQMERSSDDQRVLPVLSDSLMMTVQSFQVALKGRIQNNASRLYITMTECAFERPKLIIVHFTWQHFIGEKKKREVGNLEYRKVFSFHLKESEAPAVCRGDWDADPPLVCAALSPLMNSLLLLTDPQGRHCPDRAHL